MYSFAVLAFTGIWNLETCISVSSSSISIDYFTGIQMEHWNIGILKFGLEYWNI
jgi:hypothetical protein